LLAAHRFLLSEVEPFRLLSDKVVLVLLKQDVVFEVKIDGKDDDMSKITIYQRQKPSDYFVLILEVRKNAFHFSLKMCVKRHREIHLTFKTYQKVCCLKHEIFNKGFLIALFDLKGNFS